MHDFDSKAVLHSQGFFSLEEINMRSKKKIAINCNRLPQCLDDSTSAQNVRVRVLIPVAHFRKLAQLTKYPVGRDCAGGVSVEEFIRKNGIFKQIRINFNVNLDPYGNHRFTNLKFGIILWRTR